MKKNGFTLAELLITLTIIGVIAAITMPSLNQNTFTSQRKAGLKSMHAKLTEAFHAAIMDMGYTPKCGYWGNSTTGSQRDEYFGFSFQTGSMPDPNDPTKKIWYKCVDNTDACFSEENADQREPLPSTSSGGAGTNGLFSDCLAFGDAIIKNLHTTKICKGNAVTDGCAPTKGYISLAKTYAENPEYEDSDAAAYAANGSGYNDDQVNNKNYMANLADGTLLFSYNSTQRFYPAYFAVDINGKKGPNRWGHDLFGFTTYYAPDGRTLEIRGNSLKAYDGLSASEILNKQ